MVKITFKCRNDANIFCYICGQFCVLAQRKELTEGTKNFYSLYFGREVENQHENWAPNICCKTCEVHLNSWWNGTRNRMPFAAPMIWRKQQNHRNDCYFCTTNIAGFSSKNKNKIIYPDCKSISKPILHDDSHPVPVTPNQAVKEKAQRVDVKSLPVEDDSTSKDPDYIPDDDPHDTHKLDQSELNDLVRDLGLNKQKSELCSSRMLQWNMLKAETKVTYYRDRNKPLMKFFKIPLSTVKTLMVSWKALDSYTIQKNGGFS